MFQAPGLICLVNASSGTAGMRPSEMLSTSAARPRIRSGAGSWRRIFTLALSSRLTGTTGRETPALFHTQPGVHLAARRAGKAMPSWMTDRTRKLMGTLPSIHWVRSRAKV